MLSALAACLDVSSQDSPRPALSLLSQLDGRPALQAMDLLGGYDSGDNSSEDAAAIPEFVAVHLDSLKPSKTSPALAIELTLPRCTASCSLRCPALLQSCVHRQYAQARVSVATVIITPPSGVRHWLRQCGS